MSKNILIDTTNNIETRIAVTEDGKLDDFEIETNKKNAVKGDVYLAKITRIEPSLQAAFVDFGKERHGFLSFKEDKLVLDVSKTLPVLDDFSNLFESGILDAIDLNNEEGGKKLETILSEMRVPTDNTLKVVDLCMA